MKALIVDPSMTYRNLLVRLFEEQGFDVVAIEAGQQGLQRHLIEEYELTCVASQLADMSGVDFCRALRRQAGVGHRPVIMMAQEDNLDSREEQLQHGISEIFHKSSLPELGEYLAGFSAGHRKNSNEMNGIALLVEDDATLAQVITLMLENMGLRVERHVFGEEAKNACQQQEFDIILTDVLLAGKMTGLGLVRAIRAMEGSRARVPILVMTSLENVETKIEAFRHGASDFLTKPLMIEELVARTRNLVTNKQLLDTVEGQRERLRELAMTDQLTGLYNRHYMSDIWPKMLSEATRHGYPVSMIVADVDHFKLINDHHGHAVGDIVLREVGTMLKRTCRAGDFAGRFGGEEFVLLLQHCHARDAMNWAECMREKLEQLKPGGLNVTASFGVANQRGEMDVNFDAMFFSADQGVYAAKAAGRNRVALGPAI